MISIDSTIFIQIINLLLLVWLLNLLLFRPIRSILNEREDRLNSLRKEISKIEEKIEQTIEGVEKQLKEARLQGNKKRESLKKEGLEEEKNIINKVSQEVDAKIQQLKEDISRQVNDAKMALKDQIASFSREMAVKILGRNI